MTGCDDCRYADWHRTADGKLHPLRGGKCTYQVTLKDLPVVCRWFYEPPTCIGGYIERGSGHGLECVYWAPVEDD